jgi:hypothetical protein
MATIAVEQRQRGSPLPKVVLLAGLLLAASLAGVQYQMSHAEARHGNAGAVIRNCLQNNGTYQLWYDPTSGNFAQVCNMEDVHEADSRTWGFQIVRQVKGVFQEVTSFVCRDATCAKIENYMLNRGYMLVE